MDKWVFNKLKISFCNIHVLTMQKSLNFSNQSMKSIKIKKIKLIMIIMMIYLGMNQQIEVQIDFKELVVVFPITKEETILTKAKSNQQEPIILLEANHTPIYHKFLFNWALNQLKFKDIQSPSLSKQVQHILILHMFNYQQPIQYFTIHKLFLIKVQDWELLGFLHPLISLSPIFNLANRDTSDSFLLCKISLLQFLLTIIFLIKFNINHFLPTLFIHSLM